MTLFTPEFIAPTRHDDATGALAQVRRIHDVQTAHLRQALRRFVAGEPLPGRVRGCYPFVRIQTHAPSGPRRPELARLSYGFVAGPGRYETTLTRPDLFADYLLEQFELLLANHGAPLEVGTSNEPIPVPFAFGEGDHVDGELDPHQRAQFARWFDLPDLAAMDDGIANGTWQPTGGEPLPLALFTAPRIDYSLHRLRHYTGTDPAWFQNFVLFTNYPFYVDEFAHIGRELLTREEGWIAFVEPGHRITHADGRVEGETPPRLPQMPAYHITRADRGGITLVNIGVGPANAKTITDHIAVLRPHAWLMLGHCAGLRTNQQLGDYVLAHAYVREDHVLDEDLPLWVPIPALAEIQQALQDAVAEVTGCRGAELKRVMRTGTVASTDNRNWELLPHNTPVRRFSQSRAVALDMESATIAANGFRFRVPYGTLLCVSDKPLHGEIKLPGMANAFYRERVGQHLRIGMRALQMLREGGTERLHSRKLRSFAEVAFQ